MLTWPCAHLAAGAETPVYGIKSALVGKMLGFTLTGKAGVFAPLEQTPNGDGSLAEAKSFDREELVAATLDLARCAACAHTTRGSWTATRNLCPNIFPGFIRPTPSKALAFYFAAPACTSFSG